MPGLNTGHLFFITLLFFRVLRFAFRISCFVFRVIWRNCKL